MTGGEGESSLRQRPHLGSLWLEGRGSSSASQWWPGVSATFFPTAAGKKGCDPGDWDLS